MKGICGAVLLLAWGAHSIVADEPPAQATQAAAVESRITRVLVYSDRALVTRKATGVHLPAGRTRIAFEGLPGGIEDASVRTALPDGSPSRVANIEIESTFKTTFRKEEAEKASDELKALQAKLKTLQDQRSSLAAEGAFLGGLSFGTRPTGDRTSPLPVAPEAWARLLDFMDARYKASAAKDRDLAEQIDDVNADLVVATSKLRMLQSYKTTAVKRVVLEVESPHVAETEVEVSYIAPGPSWFPRYDVRADVTKGSLELTGYALVRQETGEDWSGVELAFSAAEPSRAADLPKLASWRIAAAEQMEMNAPAPPPPAPMQAPAVREEGYAMQMMKPIPEAAVGDMAGGAVAYQAEDVKAKKRDTSKAGRYQQDLDRIEDLYKRQDEARKSGDYERFSALNQTLGQELQNQEAGVQRALGSIANEVQSNLQVAQRMLESKKLETGLVPPVRSSGGYDYRFNGMRAEDVPSDGALTKIVVSRSSFDAEFTYEVVPEKSRTAFLRTRLKNTTSSPFLAGPVAVFLASDFVGESRVATCAPTESFELGLGADEEISITRDFERKRDTHGVFSSSYRYDVGVTLTVTNNKSRPVKITLFDRIPFTFDDEIKIKEAPADPSPSARDPKGLLRWTLEIAPKEKRKIAFGYNYEHKSTRRVYQQEDASVRW